ncbi:hypothetical protein Thiosp_02980 [Thiorhodovibrio litoralis]|nr:hypothetical protein Thiosp_02980 [Thiorhodovibrio litoralis]
MMNTLIVEATVTPDHLVRLPDDWPLGMRVRVQAEPQPEAAACSDEDQQHKRAFTGDDLLDHYQPRTEIGRLALAARRAYLESGGKLLTQDEILAEVNRRRCGDYHD